MRPQGFPASCRIRKKSEYDRAFRTGRSRHAAHFRLLVAPPATQTSRLGTVVSRKVGKAHERNRVKRRLREYFRIRRGDFATPVDLVVIAKPGAAALTSREAAQELDAALSSWFDAPPSS